MRSVVHRTCGAPMAWRRLRCVRLQRWRELSDAQKGAIEARAKELKDEYESVLHRSHYHAIQAAEPASMIDVWKTITGMSNTGFSVLCHSVGHVPIGLSILRPLYLARARAAGGVGEV